MSINNEDANKYICYLAHNIWRFPFWVEERRRERATESAGQGGNQDSQGD